MGEYDTSFEYATGMGRMADMQTDFAPQNSLSKKGRQDILKRDSNQSQMRHYSEEKGWYKNKNCEYDGEPCGHLHVHHLKTRRQGGDDEPENLLTLSECEHNGRCPSERIGPEDSI